MEDWLWQDGSTADDYIVAATMGWDGSFFLAGYTYGNWSGASSGESDWAVVKLDADGTEAWRYQGGTSGMDSFTAAAVDQQNGSVVLAGQMSNFVASTDTTSGSYAVLRIDAGGTVLWEFQAGTDGQDQTKGIAMAEDGSVVVVGATRGDWNGANGSFDFAAFRLDADGTEVWRYQEGTEKEDYLSAATMVDGDGSVVMGGYTTGGFSELSLGDNDFVAIKLNSSDSTEIWRYQDGSSETDMVYASAATEDEGVVLAGFTDGTWSGDNAGGSDFAAVKLDSDGVEVWRYQDGTSAHDTVREVAVQADGSIILAGTTDGDWSGLNAGDSNGDWALISLSTDGEENWRWQGGSGGDDDLYGMTAGPEGNILLAGFTAGSWGATNLGENDFVAAMLNTSTVATSAPSVATTVITPAPTSTPPSDAGSTSDTTPMILGVVFGVGVMVLVALGVWTLRRRGARKKDANPRPPPAVSGDFEHGPKHEPSQNAGSDEGGSAEGGWGRPQQRKMAGFAFHERRSVDVKESDTGRAGSTATSTAASLSTSGDCAESGEPSAAGREARRGGFGLAYAVMDAAQEVANHCQTPGISEAATIVSILANLVSDSRDDDSDARLRQCRAIVMMLERAAKVAGKGGETNGQAERVMIEDVHDAMFDMVELIKAYQSKNKLSKVLMSTLFRRRQEELDAVVDRAIIRLQLSLHVQVGQDVSAVREGIDVYKGSIAEAKSEALAKARSARRQRKLDQVEIPEDQVVVSDELLGSGGFGQVYLADLNGRNAAAKVLLINHDLWKRGNEEILHGREEVQSNLDEENGQRKAFLRELEAMIRLRSPHTVNIYGAVTSLPDRLVLVMELLVGGDLRTLLKNSEQPLPEEQSKQIIGDICAGMAFLHGKKTVHGDLKSANVLLDGAGRAKIGDFGTSRWSPHTVSTGLATYTAKTSQNTHMSLAWSAPEVLDATRSTYASDVYSFGIVAWEVLSRELPWANVTHPRDVYIRVVLKGLRPDFPADTPADMVDIVRACWVEDPGARPAFVSVVEDMKFKGWRE